jgi:hypothetical protein
MKQHIKDLRMLHLRADQLLELCEESQKKVDHMNKWNIETAIPNGFDIHSDAEIEFQKQVVKRIFKSYTNIVQKINNIYYERPI